MTKRTCGECEHYHSATPDVGSCHVSLPIYYAHVAGQLIVRREWNATYCETFKPKIKRKFT